MGLRLSGEVGARDGLDLAARIGLALGHSLDAGQGGDAEVDNIAPVGPQAHLFEQRAIVQKGLRMRLQPVAHARPMQGLVHVRFRPCEKVQ